MLGEVGKSAKFTTPGVREPKRLGQVTPCHRVHRVKKSPQSFAQYFFAPLCLGVFVVKVLQ